MASKIIICGDSSQIQSNKTNGNDSHYCSSIEEFLDYNRNTSIEKTMTELKINSVTINLGDACQQRFWSVYGPLMKKLEISNCSFVIETIEDLESVLIIFPQQLEKLLLIGNTYSCNDPERPILYCPGKVMQENVKYLKLRLSGLKGGTSLPLVWFLRAYPNIEELDLHVEPKCY